ncbi:MAG: hypothetical protein Q7J63_06935 [Rhodonellum sp.]|nr:hypothetical protein [Rhodonellum sp.]MDO9552219.1 hypothetical protein [Rhodonellum sp.]
MLDLILKIQVNEKIYLSHAPSSAERRTREMPNLRDGFGAFWS